MLYYIGLGEHFSVGVVPDEALEKYDAGCAVYSDKALTKQVAREDIAKDIEENSTEAVQNKSLPEYGEGKA